MKRILAVLFALMMVFTFAAAETGTETEQAGSFRDMMSEEELAAGTYTSLGGLPMQVWMPNNKFTELEIPDDNDEYEYAVAYLAYTENPDYRVTVKCLEADQSYEDLIATLTDPDFAAVFQDVQPAVANGFDAVSYTYNGEEDEQTRIIEFYVDGFLVVFSFPVVEDAMFMQYASMMSASMEAKTAD